MFTQLAAKFVKDESPFPERGWATQELGGLFQLGFSCFKLTKSPFCSPFDKGGRGKSKQLFGKQTGIHNI